MRVYLHKFAKRINSTAQPLVQDGTPVDVTFKDDTNVLTPELRLLWSGSGNPTEYNYLQAPDLLVGYMIGSTYSTSLRYYWIKSWTYSERQWVAQCELDVLATWRNAIANSTKYVLRSAAQYNPTIPDGMYVLEAGCTTRKITQSSPLWQNSFAGGKYVVGIVGQGNTFNIGGVGYVVCTAQQLKDLINAAFTGADALWPATLGSATDIGEVMAAYGEKLQQSMSNPYQFINSVMWVPFDPATDGTVTITLGYIQTSVTAGALSSATFVKAWQYALPDPLDVDDYWKCLAPYRRVVLCEQCFGTFELDTTKLLTGEYVACYCTVDVVTGAAVLECRVTRAGVQMPMLFRTTASLGVQIPISGQMVNVANAITQTVGAAESAVKMFTGRGSITGTTSAIMSAAEAFMPEAVGGGNISGNVSCFDPGLASAMYIYDWDIIDQDVAEKGRPLCEEWLLRDLPGFQMLADGHLTNIIATSTEHEAIRQYLEGGYFFV